MRLVLLAAIAVGGCAKEPTGPELLAQVRQTLADRDARLAGYQFDLAVTAEGRTSHSAFYFRSPNKMRSVLGGYDRSFDGELIHEIDAKKKTFTVYTLKLPPERASMLLHQLFANFVPEGFRMPLMPMKGVTAKKVGDAVELTIRPGERITIVYKLRWPGGDFLESRIGTDVMKVEKEHCDAALKLCVPQQLVDYEDGVRAGDRTLSNIVLNPGLGTDAFVPPVPEGFTREARDYTE